MNKLIKFLKKLTLKLEKKKIEKLNQDERIKYHAVELFNILKGEMNPEPIKSFTVYGFDEYYNLDFVNCTDKMTSIKIDKEEN